MNSIVFQVYFYFTHQQLFHTIEKHTFILRVPRSAHAKVVLGT